MFGEQAIRLLRENWGGLVFPDSDGNLREHGATMLAEELYAMFLSDEPLQTQAPTQFKQPTPGTTFTISDQYGNPTFQVTDGNVTINGNPIGGGGGGGGGTGTGVRSADAETIPFGDPATAEFDPTTENIHFGIPEGRSVESADAETVAFGDPADAIYDTETRNIHFKIPAGAPGPSGGGGGGGTGTNTAMLGKVVSGSGDTYTVLVYPDGVDTSPDTVSVKVEGLAAGQDLHADDWLTVVRHAIGLPVVVTYEAAVPAPVPSTYLGLIASGSGDTYSVALYGNGSGQPATATVSVKFPTLDPASALPAGFPVIVVKNLAGTYDAVTAMWLPPPPP